MYSYWGREVLRFRGSGLARVRVHVPNLEPSCPRRTVVCCVVLGACMCLHRAWWARGFQAWPVCMCFTWSPRVLCGVHACACTQLQCKGYLTLEKQESHRVWHTLHLTYRLHLTCIDCTHTHTHTHTHMAAACSTVYMWQQACGTIYVVASYGTV